MRARDQLLDQSAAAVVQSSKFGINSGLHNNTIDIVRSQLELFDCCMHEGSLAYYTLPDLTKAILLHRKTYSKSDASFEDANCSRTLVVDVFLI